MVRVRLDDETTGYVREMAKEAGCSVEELVAVAIYNLVALWMKEKGINEVSLESGFSHDVDIVSE